MNLYRSWWLPGDATWVRPRDFRTYGLEFDSGYGTRRFHLDGVSWIPRTAGTTPEESQTSSWHEHRAELGRGAGGGFIAFARGKNEYLPAAPCEFCPEVQRLWRWRGQIACWRRGSTVWCSASRPMGPSPTSPMNTDSTLLWWRPTGNGTESTSGAEDFDPDLLGALRGEAYTRFVREASAMTRRAGKHFQVQVHTEAFRPDPVFGQAHGISGQHPVRLAAVVGGRARRWRYP